MTSDESNAEFGELRLVYELRSPDLSDDKLYEYARSLQDELTRELQEVVAEELPDAEARVEIAHGSVLLILIIVSKYVVSQGGGAVVGAAVVGALVKGPGKIKKIFGKKKPTPQTPATEPPPAQPQNVTVNVYVRADPQIDPRTYEALVEMLAAMSDEELEKALENVAPEHRQALLEEMRRRRGMGAGGSRAEPVPA